MLILLKACCYNLFIFYQYRNFFMQNLVIGCGLSGATIAYKIATEWNERVVVIDQKNHIGGHCYDYLLDNISVHKYGPHIFHTDMKDVWGFVSKFTEWLPYQHKVKALVDGIEVPIPFNLNSIYQVFPERIAKKIETKLLNYFGFNIKVPILELRKTQDNDLLFLANYVYEKVFLHYTLKQWGLKPQDLHPSVTERVPVYISRDDRYFQNIYQGIPIDGYTKIIENMINHSNIEVKLNTKYIFDKNDLSKYCRIFYTGSIDEFFCYSLGVLPYRSVNFNFISFDRAYFQKNSVVNYPSNYEFTRITEYKYFTNVSCNKTIISYEYPEPFNFERNDRYYPIMNIQNQTLFGDYLDKAKLYNNLYFLGRLGDYKYFDMDQAIYRALDLIRQLR